MRLTDPRRAHWRRRHSGKDLSHLRSSGARTRAGRFLLSLLPWVGYLFLKFIGASQQARVVNLRVVKEAFAKHGCAIFAFWHNRLMMIPYIYRRLFGKKDIVTLISSSRDGEYFVRALKLFRPYIVRGSSTRGGSEAFKALVRRIRQGMDCIITPDGPQGPKYTIQPGTIALARLTGIPIIPVSYWSSRYRILNTWDGFILTLPFGKMTYAFGEPVYCPKDASDSQMDCLADALRQSLLATSRLAGESCPLRDSARKVRRRRFSVRNDTM